MKSIAINVIRQGVTSRTVVRLFLATLWFEFVPGLHRLQGCFAPAPRRTSEVAGLVEPDVAICSVAFQLLPRIESAWPL